jgi:hypothetical protein
MPRRVPIGKRAIGCPVLPLQPAFALTILLVQQRFSLRISARRAHQCLFKNNP